MLSMTTNIQLKRYINIVGVVVGSYKTKILLLITLSLKI